MKSDSSWSCQRGCVRHQLEVILGLVIFALLPAMVQSWIAHSQHHLVVQEGENMVFDQCPSPPDSDGHWGYKMSLETKDYSECWGKCSTCSSCELIIPDVIRSCGGYYQYNTSPDSNGTRWRCDLQLDVYYPPSPIRIDNPQPNVFEGDDVTMTCSTDDVGNPPGNFTGRQFPKTTGTQNSTSVRLQATRERDGEEIVCEFEYRRFNQTRSNTTTARLTVFYLPKTVSIKERDSTTTFNVGDNVTLRCIVGKSNPNSTISWWKDDVILRGETSANFVINSVSVQDSGTYKCKATIQALSQNKSKESKVIYISVTSPGPTHGTPSSKTGTNALLTTIDLVIIGSAAFVVMVIILVVTALLCFWKRRESRDNRTQNLHANGSFQLVPSRHTDDVIVPGSDRSRGNLDGEEFEPQPPPYSRVNPDPRFPTTQTCPWADGACHLPLVTHYQSPRTTLTPSEAPNNGAIPQAAASVPSVTEGTRPKVLGDGPRSVEDSSIPDKPGSLRSHPELHVPRPLPANLTISNMISEAS